LVNSTDVPEERIAKQDTSKNRQREQPEDGEGYVSQERKTFSTELHGVIAQKTELLIELRNSNQTQTPI
jgi:hypothetical protein